jgi:predicted NUDIX family NTP pyrophosphohydrolase
MSPRARKESAGLLLYRRRAGRLEVLLGHPGGPFWAGKHDGAWTIPKGGIHEHEDPLDSARREFAEETGLRVDGPFIPLGEITQRSGKLVRAWAVAGDCDTEACVSNTTHTEWPPRSGRYIVIPELDRVQFFAIDDARAAINVGQVPFLDRLEALLDQ